MAVVPREQPRAEGVAAHAVRWPGLKEMERVMGIEPTSKAWEALVLPLNHTRADRAGAFSPVQAAAAGSTMKVSL